MIVMAKIARKYIRLIFFIILSTVSFYVTPATSEMMFETYKPDQYQVVQGDIGWTIFASGEIDVNAADRLENIIKKENIPQRSRLYIDSVGGNLFGGIKLGKGFRSHELITTVGKLRSSDVYDVAPAVCLSACVPAFIGGAYRYWNAGSVIGVHRFFWESDQGDADLAQVVSAALVEHIRMMGVDTELFTLASSAGKDEFVSIDEEEARRIKLTNNGSNDPIWTIESIDQGIYLKGEQDTVNGLNKFMIACAPDNPISLFIIFNAGINIDKAMGMEAISISIDHKSYPININAVSRDRNGSDIVLGYTLNNMLISNIKRARNLGVYLQFAFDAPTYMGFDISTEGGSKKMPGFFRACQGM